MAEDSEVSLPRATIVKMIREFMPPDVRVASETMDLMLQCCTEFIALVGSEANNFAAKSGKKTMLPEHVIGALQELGYDDFCDEVSETLRQFKEDAKATSSHRAALRKTGADLDGLTEEEQIALQQQMFAAARAASMTTEETAAQMAAAYQAQLQQQQQQQRAQPPQPPPEQLPQE